MIGIYDFNRDLLDEVQLSSLSKNIDFFIDNQNHSRFVTDDHEVSKYVRITQKNVLI